MRIAIFHDLPSGGAKRALREVAARLAAEHSLDVFSLTSAEHSFGDLRPFAGRHQLFAFTPLPLFRSPLGRLNNLQRWRDLQRLDRLGREAARTIDAGGYDVVFAHPSMWTQAPLLLRHLRTPSVYYAHEPLRLVHEAPIARPYTGSPRRDRLNKLDPLIALYRRRLARLDADSTRRATRRLSNSHFSAANIQRIYGCQVQVAPVGVDTQTFRPVAAGSDNGAAETEVLSVGALRPNKGFDFVIRALGRIAPAERPRLRIVANADDAQEHAYLVNLARDHQVRLAIELRVSEPTLARRYAEAALLVYAPVNEPFGLAPLEAMACGTPVVTVAEGGVPESVVDGRTGCLVARDEGLFAGAAQSLLADAEPRARYGAQARAHVLANWTWDQAAARVGQFLLPG